MGCRAVLTNLWGRFDQMGPVLTVIPKFHVLKHAFVQAASKDTQW